MKNRIVPVLFVIAVAAISLFAIKQRYFTVEKEDSVVSKLIVPVVKQQGGEDGEDSGFGSEEGSVSLIPLNSDETLYGTLSQDFDGDGYDDQVNAIKSSNSPYMQLLVGLYNPSKQTYERSTVILTEISQVRTFSYTGIDLTGTHKTALVYQGFAENGNSVMQVFHISRNMRDSLQAPILQRIASLKSDGTIFIQQVDRDDSYMTSQSSGTPYPIWTYSSDSSNPESTDQIQTRWEWNSSSQVYVQSEQIRVTGSLIAARELAKIQDGTVDTFANFLEGLWYKTENQGTQMHYIAFDWNDEKQIVFLSGSEEGVYDWQNSSIRRNGIYISTTNFQIENLQRRIDISLRSKDEIRVHIQDDVRMFFSETSSWDGYYKKVNFTTNLEHYSSNNGGEAKKYIEFLEKASSWKALDGTVVKFSDEKYSAIGDSMNDNGIYAPLESSGMSFIQFRSQTKTSFLSGTYLVVVTSSAADESNKEAETVILTPYVVTPTSAYQTQGKVVILNHNE